MTTKMLTSHPKRSEHFGRLNIMGVFGDLLNLCAKEGQQHWTPQSHWMSLTFWTEIILLHIRSKQDIHFYKGRLGAEYWITACGILQEKQKIFHGIQVSLKFLNQKGKHYTGPYEIERLTFVTLTQSQGHLNTAVSHTFLIIKPWQLKPPFHIFLSLLRKAYMHAYIKWRYITWSGEDPFWEPAIGNCLQVSGQKSLR